MSEADRFLASGAQPEIDRQPVVSPSVPERLVVGRVDDPAERAADVAAARATAVLARWSAGESGWHPGEVAGDRVNRSMSVTTPPAGATGPSGRVQRSATIGADGGEVDSTLDARIRRAQRSGGAPLDGSVRAPMEQALGADLGHVRVHHGSESTQLNDSISASAFTVGSDVFFRGGMPDVGSASGQHLMAHELAHTVQNGGTARRIQRMPSSATIKERTGKESKKGTKIFGKRIGATNSYNAVLAAVDAYRSFLEKTDVPKNANLLDQQLPSFKVRLDAIVKAAETYLAKDDAEPEVATVCRELIAMAPYELRAAKDVGLALISKGPVGSKLGGTPKWVLHMPRDPRQGVAVAQDMQAKAVTAVTGGAADRGANKEVTKVTNSTGATGFFAKDDQTGQYQGEEWNDPRGVLDQYGTTDQDLRLGNRSIAMSRLDQLLQGGVIARTEKALKGDQLGTFMWEAQGFNAKTALAVDTSNDSNLPRLLSKLQLIDTIAGQVDRHAGNYFVQKDPSGRVTGITGIDLDMSWVERNPDARATVDVERGGHMQQGKNEGLSYEYFPGFSRFVDEDMALAIIAMSPNDLRAILVDLLTEGQIESAVERLGKLQALLIGLRDDGKLLKPNQWTEHIRAQIIDENKSYYSRDVGGKKREDWV